MSERQAMKPTHWLLIGGEGHGKAIWVKGGTSVKYPSKNSIANDLLYVERTYVLDGKLYRLGIHNATDVEMAQIPDLINQHKLEAIGIVQY